MNPSETFLARVTKSTKDGKNDLNNPYCLARVKKILHLIEALRKIKSIYVVEMVDYYVNVETGKNTFIFKYFKGMPLFEKIQAMRDEDASLKEEVLISFFAQMCKGVNELDKLNFTHGNLSLNSFMWDSDSQRQVLLPFSGVN